MNFNPVLMKWAEKRGGGSAPETESKTVSLELASGNQIVTPTEGKLLSEVTIEKPANLLPENIAEGVNIAGVIGALAAGGSSVKIATGSLSVTSSKGTFNHNLGEIPDLILVVPNEALSGDGTANRHYLCFGCSAKFAAAYPSLPKGVRVIYNNSKMYTYLVSKPMEENGSGNISNVTETGFSVSGPTCSCAWIAIGGLT